jgi:3D (Asp-Asp-Asp) domain-containing protein
MGLFAFSGTTSAMANATPAVQAPVTSIIASAVAPESYTVTMTSYNAVPAQTKADPYITAAGVYSNPEVIAARSRDLADELPFGTVIRVSGPTNPSPDCGYGSVENQIGYRVIADTMNARMHNKIDILLNQDNTVQVGNTDVNPSVALGVCGVSIQVVGHIDLNDIPQTQTALAQMVESTAIAQTIQSSQVALQ